MKNNFTIVTGASSNHSKQLINLLWSIGEWAYKVQVAWWNLGLSQPEIDDIEKFIADNKILAVRKDFDYSKYPAWFDITKEKGRMAFRPVAISQAADEFGGIILWLDAGCILRGRLDEIKLAAQMNGYACHYRRGDVGMLLHKQFGDSHKFVSHPIADPCVVAFDTTRPEMLAAIKKWESWMMQKNIAAPDGSTDKNHNPDAIFSVLLGDTNKLRPFACFNILSHQDHWNLNYLKANHGRGGMKIVGLNPPSVPTPKKAIHPAAANSYRNAIVTVIKAKSLPQLSPEQLKRHQMIALARGENFKRLNANAK